MHNFRSYTIYKAIFSPTYGTAHAASILAEQLSLNIASEKIQKLDLTFPSAREIQHYFSDSDLVIAGAPVYGGQLPPVKELFENLHGNQTPCVLLACYGNRDYEDALAQLKALMIRQGFLPVGAIACVIPHVFSEKVGAGRPNVADLSAISGFANALKAKFEYDRFEIADVPGNPAPDAKPKKDVPSFWINPFAPAVGCALLPVPPAPSIGKLSPSIRTNASTACAVASSVLPKPALSMRMRPKPGWKPTVPNPDR